MSPLPPPPDPLFVTKWDLWCFRRKLKLREIAEALDCSHEHVRRSRLPFGDPMRAIPDEIRMNKIVAWTEGEIQPGDFYPTPGIGAALANRAIA